MIGVELTDTQSKTVLQKHSIHCHTVRDRSGAGGLRPGTTGVGGDAVF